MALQASIRMFPEVHLASLRQMQPLAQPARKLCAINSSRGQSGHLRDNVIDLRRLEPAKTVHVEKRSHSHPCRAFVPVHPCVAGHQTLREYGGLVEDHVGFAMT